MERINSFKYNYVIAGGTGYYETAYSELFRLVNVVYHPTYVSGIKSSFLRMVLRLNFNLKINRFIKSPLKFVAYPLLYPHSFKEQKPLCYIFFQTQYAVINSSYLEYLRKRYHGVKIVLYMQDIVASNCRYDIDNYRDRFDCSLSYDKGDSIKYGLRYYPTPYSRIELKHQFTQVIDVFFCGAGKSRYQAIFDVYCRLNELGYKCKFFITGVPKDKRLVCDDIIYDKPISYVENLKYVMSSKCVLEVMQDNADGFTPRLWEAIMYDKHLLTNNKSIKYSVYWTSNGIHIIDESLDFDFLSQSVKYPRELKESKSPIFLLQEIESLLSGEIFTIK